MVKNLALRFSYDSAFRIRPNGSVHFVIHNDDITGEKVQTNFFLQFLNGSYISGKPEAYKRQCFPGFAGLHVELHVPVFWIKILVIKN